MLPRFPLNNLVKMVREDFKTATPHLCHPGKKLQEFVGSDDLKTLMGGRRPCTWRLGPLEIKLSVRAGPPSLSACENKSARRVHQCTAVARSWW